MFQQTSDEYYQYVYGFMETKRYFHLPLNKYSKGGFYGAYIMYRSFCRKYYHLPLKKYSKGGFYGAYIMYTTFCRKLPPLWCSDRASASGAGCH